MLAVCFFITSHSFVISFRLPLRDGYLCSSVCSEKFDREIIFLFSFSLMSSFLCVFIWSRRHHVGYEIFFYFVGQSQTERGRNSKRVGEGEENAAQSERGEKKIIWQMAECEWKFSSAGRVSVTADEK